MSDILTTWEPWLLTGDWALDGPDLAIGSDLETSVIISLFTDRLALPGSAYASGKFEYPPPFDVLVLTPAFSQP